MALDPQNLTDDELALIERTSRRSAQDVLSRYVRGALIGFAILIIGMMLATSLTSVNACERVNVLRAQSNLSDLTSFNILSSSGRRELYLAKHDQQNLRKAHRRSAYYLLSQAENLNVTPMTDCVAANVPFKPYHYPLAGPIGNPRTGKIPPDIKKVLKQSRKLAKANRVVSSK